MWCSTAQHHCKLLPQAHVVEWKFHWQCHLKVSIIIIMKANFKTASVLHLIICSTHTPTAVTIFTIAIVCCAIQCNFFAVNISLQPDSMPKPKLVTNALIKHVPLGTKQCVPALYGPETIHQVTGHQVWHLWPAYNMTTWTGIQGKNLLSNNMFYAAPLV